MLDLEEERETDNLMREPHLTHSRAPSGFQKLYSIGKWLFIIVVISSVVAVLVLRNIAIEKELRASSASIVFLQGQLNDLKSAMNKLEKQLSINQEELENKYDGESRVIERLSWNVTQMSSEMILMRNVTARHERALVRLSNGTSNADVLDEMKALKLSVDTSLHSTLDTMDDRIAYMEGNVTQQLAMSELATRKAIISINSVVNDATDNIYSVQRNVTDRMAAMSQTVSQSVNRMDIAVANATTEIHSQVVHIQDYIEAYVEFSNTQFAAENDFVRYHLAGIMYTCYVK